MNTPEQCYMFVEATDRRGKTWRQLFRHPSVEYAQHIERLKELDAGYHEMLIMHLWQLPHCFTGLPINERELKLMLQDWPQPFQLELLSRRVNETIMLLTELEVHLGRELEKIRYEEKNNEDQG